MIDYIPQRNDDENGILLECDTLNHTSFYLVKFNIMQNEYYTFWYTDDVDGFLLENDKKLQSFTSEEDAKSFAKNRGVEIEDEILLISSDILIQLKEELDCNLILTYWNIMSDVAKSVNGQFLGDSSIDVVQGIYKKLFYGCNLPALKRDDEDFVPQWTENEKRWIIKVIENGFEVLAKVLI